MATTSRTGTLMLLSRLSKSAMQRAPEDAMGMAIRHYMTLHHVTGSVPQHGLAETLCMDANTVVILLNELEDRGWIVRERDPADRRRHLVRMTDAGEKAYARAQLSRDLVEDDVLGALSESERQTLHDLLAKALGEHG